MTNRHSGLPEEGTQTDGEPRLAQPDPDRKEDRHGGTNDYEPIRWFEVYLA